MFVTHDQGEALSMSNRIAVFNDGRIEQVGTPREIYEPPGDGVRRRLRRHLEPARRRAVGSGCSASRAPHIDPARADPRSSAGDAPADGEVAVAGVVTDIQYLGAECRVRVDLDATARATFSPACRATGSLAWPSAEPIRLAWPRLAAFTVADDRNQHRGDDQ